MRTSTPWSQQCERKTMNILTNFLSFSFFSWWSLYTDHYWATDSAVNFMLRSREHPYQFHTCIPGPVGGDKLHLFSLAWCITQLHSSMLTQHPAPCLQLSSFHMPKMRSILAEPWTDLSICGRTIPLTAAKLYRMSCNFKNDTKHVILKMTQNMSLEKWHKICMQQIQYGKIK